MSEEREASGREALDGLYWRDEILQALYWMRGEGLAEVVTPTTLAAFLAADLVPLRDHLERLADEGFVERTAASADDQRRAYRLSPLGAEEGSRSFHDEFADLTRPTHGECTPDCRCHDTEHAGEPCPSHPERQHGSREE